MTAPHPPIMCGLPWGAQCPTCLFQWPCPPARQEILATRPPGADRFNDTFGPVRQRWTFDEFLDRWVPPGGLTRRVWAEGQP